MISLVYGHLINLIRHVIGNEPERFHVAMWDGSTWAAEGKASNVVPYKSGSFIVKVYRYQGSCSNAAYNNSTTTSNNIQSTPKRLLIIGDSIAAGAKNSGLYSNADFRM